MSDDLVKQSIAELQDLVRCRCHDAYKGRGLHDPTCCCDYAEALKVVSDRIKELEAKLAKADKLASEFKNCLEVLTKEDGYVCCSGHQCGCYGASLHAQAIYYANEAIDDYHKTTGGKDE